MHIASAGQVGVTVGRASPSPWILGGDRVTRHPLVRRYASIAFSMVLVRVELSSKARYFIRLTSSRSIRSPVTLGRFRFLWADCSISNPHQNVLTNYDKCIHLSSAGWPVGLARVAIESC